MLPQAGADSVDAVTALVKDGDWLDEEELVAVADAADTMMRGSKAWWANSLAKKTGTPQQNWRTSHRRGLLPDGEVDPARVRRVDREVISTHWVFGNHRYDVARTAAQSHLQRAIPIAATRSAPDVELVGVHAVAAQAGCR